VRVTALAIGGIAAGEMITGEYGYAHVARTAPLSPQDYLRMPDPPWTPTMHHSYYELKTVRYANSYGFEREFRFWVDMSTIKDEGDLLSALANGYRPVREEPRR